MPRETRMAAPVSFSRWILSGVSGASTRSRLFSFLLSAKIAPRFLHAY
jgi:hypothetical protein